MRQLLILRHAKSSWDEPDQPDHMRPLNPRGKQAALALRQEFLNRGLIPDHILVSSARRTQETLQALEPWPQPVNVQVLDSLYLALPDSVLDALHDAPPDARCILLVGHNPGLHELTLQLAAPDKSNATAHDTLLQGLPTGGLVEFDVPTPWSELRAHGAILQRFTRPRDLPIPS